MLFWFGFGPPPPEIRDVDMDDSEKKDDKTIGEAAMLTMAMTELEISMIAMTKN